jgi:hypothetical protein
MIPVKTKLTPEQVKALTPEEYVAEVNRLVAEVIRDFARTMDGYRTYGTSLARVDGTGEHLTTEAEPLDSPFFAK